MSKTNEVQRPSGDWRQDLSLLFDLISRCHCVLTPTDESFWSTKSGIAFEPSAWQSLLDSLVKRLAINTGATEVRMSLNHLAFCIHAAFPEEFAKTSDEPSREVFYGRRRLTAPICTSEATVGYLDLALCDMTREFSTQHKRLIEAVAALLGITIERELLNRANGRSIGGMC